MSKELETFIINDEDSYKKESKYNFLNNRCFKKIDKKYKIGLAIFIAIILGLLCILIILAFHSSPAPKIQKEQTEEIKKTEESEEEGEKREMKLLNLTKMPEFKKYYDNFPYTLTIDKNGKFDINYDTLEHVPVENLSAHSFNYYEFKSIEINEESKASSSEIYDLTLSFDKDITLHSDIKFNIKIEEITNGSKNVSYIMIKKVLGSLSINKVNIQLTESYIKEIKNLANQEFDSIKGKAMALDKLFSENGYFIPTTIIIGGYLCQEISQIENENIKKIINDFKGNINYKQLVNSSAEYNRLNEEVFKYLFLEKKITIVGGNSSQKSFDEWEKSVNFENAEIIEHSKKTSIFDLIDTFLDTDIKNKLNEPLKLVSQKYEKREKYYDDLNEAKNSIIANTIEGDYDQKNGICKNEDLIYSIKIEIREAGKRIISDYFSDIIVGWHINACWGLDDDGENTNGIYNFKDPILSKRIYFEFTSKTWWWIFFTRSQCYDLEIFLMKRPELGD